MLKCNFLASFGLLAAILTVTGNAHAADQQRAEPDGYVCAQVMPTCDGEGHVSGLMADRTSPCYYYYDNLCLKEKVRELTEAQASCDSSEAQARKLKARIRRECRRK
jgi:hypothetical protein